MAEGRRAKERARARMKGNESERRLRRCRPSGFSSPACFFRPSGDRWSRSGRPWSCRCRCRCRLVIRCLPTEDQFHGGKSLVCTSLAAGLRGAAGIHGPRSRGCPRFFTPKVFGPMSYWSLLFPIGESTTESSWTKTDSVGAVLRDRGQSLERLVVALIGRIARNRLGPQALRQGFTGTQ